MRQLNDSDKIRFDRQMRIDGWGEKGQKKLKNATVGILGIGGLGCPISIYLAVAGVGKIILVDKDTVELSNLNRQILHWNKDINKFKALSAKQKLSEINPDVEIITYTEEVNENNIEGIFDGV
ncbi:MAG: HesA/MoeB/ThiF family protein, partial [Candidatus Poribacteria bacterium]